MTPIRRILYVLPVALLAVSCASADTLASVNGQDVTRAELVALRPSYSDVAAVSAEQLRSDLTLLIFLEAVREAASDQFGYEMTETEVEERLANPPPRYAAVIAPAEQFPDVTEEAIRTSATQSLVRDAVVPELAEADLGGFDELIDQQPELVTRACVRHISTSTIDQAEAALGRLESGEEFEVVAAEVSSDQASPGGLISNTDGECLIWLTRAGAELSNLAATAPLNTPVGPVMSDGQWEVIVVVDRLAPASAEELAADPMEFLDPDYISSLYTPWLNEAVADSEIDVSPTVGRWSAAGVGIVPPGE